MKEAYPGRSRTDVRERSEFPVTLQVETKAILSPFKYTERIAWAFSSVGESAVLIRLRSLVRTQKGPPKRATVSELYQVHREEEEKRKQTRTSESAQERHAHGECPGAAEPKKDGARHRKRRGGVLRPVIRRSPNGETPPLVTLTREARRGTETSQYPRQRNQTRFP